MKYSFAGRFYAFDQAHEKDPSSSGRGVRQFKTALLHKLERVCGGFLVSQSNLFSQISLFVKLNIFTCFVPILCARMMSRLAVKGKRPVTGERCIDFMKITIQSI